MIRAIREPRRAARAAAARTTSATVLLLATTASAALAQHAAHSPYAGAGSDEVKTLTEDEVAELLEGEGMGLARPAELNGYPGPRHVLDLADSLALTDEQVARTRGLFETMQAEAIALGRRIVDGEKELDALFAAGAAPDAVEAAVREIARLSGELRLVHLRAHLTLTGILTEHQRHEYARLRGYDAVH